MSEAQPTDGDEEEQDERRDEFGTSVLTGPPGRPTTGRRHSPCRAPVIGRGQAIGMRGKGRHREEPNGGLRSGRVTGYPRAPRYAFPMLDPDVTVLIATRDRAEHLRASLDTVLASTIESPFPTEVLMVDNGSTDGTDQLLSELSQTWPGLRAVDDPVPGKSGALNRALGQVRGRAVVFTDDDVHVPTTWVADMATPILEGTADAVCGKVELAPHLARPWLTPALRMKLAEVSDVSGPFPGMVGANMAASAEAVRSIGFDEELGPGGRGMGDDVLFNLRLKAAGYRLVGSSGPPVVHHLSPDRLRYEPMRRLAQSNGSSHAYLWHHWLHDDLGLLLLRRLRARARLSWTRARTPRDPDSITVREYERWYDLSFATHLAAERVKPPRYPPTGTAADEPAGSPSWAGR